MKKSVINFLLLLVFVVPAAAQEVPNAVNYCAATLTYELPQGWISGDEQITQYGAALRIANSTTALNSAAPTPGLAVIIVNVIGRQFLADGLGVSPTAPLTTILAAVGAQAASGGFTSNGVAEITVGDQDAVRLDVHSATLDMAMVAVDLDADALGMVVLSTPAGEVASQNAALLDFAGSLAFDAPHYVLAEGSTLSQIFATDDCAVSFAYPAGWNAQGITQSPGQFYQIQVRNFESPTSGASSAYTLTPGRANIQLGIIMPVPDDDSGDLESFAEEVAQQPGYTIVSKEDLTIGDQTARVIQMHVDVPDQGLAGDSLQISIPYDDAIVALALYAAPGELERWRDQALAIAQSLAVDVSSAQPN